MGPSPATQATRVLAGGCGPGAGEDSRSCPPGPYVVRWQSLTLAVSRATRLAKGPVDAPAAQKLRAGCIGERLATPCDHRARHGCDDREMVEPPSRTCRLSLASLDDRVAVASWSRASPTTHPLRGRRHLGEWYPFLALVTVTQPSVPLCIGTRSERSDATERHPPSLTASARLLSSSGRAGTLILPWHISWQGDVLPWRICEPRSVEEGSSGCRLRNPGLGEQ